MRSWLAIIAAAILTACLASCAATGLGVECPSDFVAVNGTCVCADDKGCPTGHSCHNGICVCSSDLCCPGGFHYDSAGQQCVCVADSCCPSGYRFDATSSECACNDPSCCPVGFVFNTIAGTCTCDGTDCCPQGFFFEVDAGLPLDDGGFERIVLDGGEKGVCACDSDACCPIDYRWDGTRTACVCAQSSCCPANYTYDPAAFACVCNGDACCPKGYIESQTAGHCVCANDASCGVGQVCSADAGRCVCTSSAGCSPDQFCNSLGFCQTLSGCVSNADCPPDAGMFCDSITSRCLVGPRCTQDANCVVGDICNLADGGCVPGCRTTDDCPLQKSCSGGTCVPSCLNNQYCQVGEDCNTATGTCSFDPNPDYCGMCSGVSGDCPNTGVGGVPDACLMFIIEGQTELFCGVACNTSADCPSGYNCGVSLENCAGPGDLSCSAAAANSYCQQYQVVNESMPLFLCANPATGQPLQLQSYCAPLSGTCLCNGSVCLPEAPCLSASQSCPPN